jgi:hypothetical protein
LKNIKILSFLVLTLVTSDNSMARAGELPDYLLVKNIDEQTTLIDDALLMTYFTAFGIETSIYRQFKDRPNIEQIMACAHPRAVALARKHYASGMKSALSKDDIKLGARLASSEVFPKVNNYIKVNFRSLMQSSKNISPENKMNHYMLLTAGENLNISENEKQDIINFINWDKAVSPKLSKQEATNFDEFTSSIGGLIINCKSAK